MRPNLPPWYYSAGLKASPWQFCLSCAAPIILIVQARARMVAMARVKHVVRWRSVGAATTFLLAAAAGVAGNRLTGRLTPALVTFAVLVVAGMLVTYALERLASAREADGPGAERSAAGEAGRIDLRGAEGVQIGNHNRQQNDFGPGREPGPHE